MIGRMEDLLSVVVIGFWIAWPVMCYNLARRKGRSPGLAIVAGIAFGLFAVLYYLTVGERKG